MTTNERKQLIIEEASALFANKGYDATSIQEIATACDISKGAFYLHFKSKEALLLSIFQYNQDHLRKKIRAIEALHLPARDTFIKQLSMQLSEIIERRDFIIMHYREQTVALNDEIRALTKATQREIQEWYENMLLTIYGQQLTPYRYDLSLLLDGIRNGFIRLLLITSLPLNTEEIGTYILHRMDDLVKGILHQAAPPLLKEEAIQRFFQPSSSPEPLDAKDLVLHMKTIVPTLTGEASLLKESEKAILHLERILSQEDVDVYSVRGALTIIQQLQPLTTYCHQLAQHYDITL
ncbi:TetR family transcriptional regulator [Fictibacillus macauensis ZFHKF-1]|uniref:TetR family transcriptional regulator n=1 Tax=Fictibacillus macauensis ZFHKF-1 TaxID=1196324 RepID=I8ALK0_9BACL|nr:TetR/AcrR family transcriptional regulator [Fictibacillus macauensis]EIT86792.1 TetR family transcriptional regulator [Fictibacillus macauensis ZFHKF-1]